MTGSKLLTNNRRRNLLAAADACLDSLTGRATAAQIRRYVALESKAKKGKRK